jgi:hypothetical protein
MVSLPQAWRGKAVNAWWKPSAQGILDSSLWWQAGGHGLLWHGRHPDGVVASPVDNSKQCCLLQYQDKLAQEVLVLHGNTRALYLPSNNMVTGVPRASVVYCSIKTSWRRKCWCCMAIPGPCTCHQTTWSLVFLGSVLFTAVSRQVGTGSVGAAWQYQGPIPAVKQHGHWCSSGQCCLLQYQDKLAQEVLVLHGNTRALYLPSNNMVTGVPWVSVVYCSIKTSWHRKCWCCMAIPGPCTCRQTTWSLVLLGSVLCHIFTRFYLIRLWPVWQGEGSIEQLLIPWPWWLAEHLQVSAYYPIWLICCIHQTVARMRAEVHWH